MHTLIHMQRDQREVIDVLEYQSNKVLEEAICELQVSLYPCNMCVCGVCVNVYTHTSVRERYIFMYAYM
jgi:hypothetical protein